jgi:hypothetical protein
MVITVMDLEGSGHGQILRYCPCICLEGSQKMGGKKTAVRVVGVPEYEAAVYTEYYNIRSRVLGQADIT